MGVYFFSREYLVLMSNFLDVKNKKKCFWMYSLTTVLQRSNLEDMHLVLKKEDQKLLTYIFFHCLSKLFGIRVSLVKPKYRKWNLYFYTVVSKPFFPVRGERKTSTMKVCARNLTSSFTFIQFRFGKKKGTGRMSHEKPIS